MDFHGRQQLLKKSRRQGQAIVELLPAIVLFLMVITAGLTYFQAMRYASIRQEVVRNIAFAKIDNSGTLTSTPDQLKNLGGGVVNMQSRELKPLVAGPFNMIEAHDFVDYNTPCFVVYPKDWSTLFPTASILSFFGRAPPGPIQMVTYAVVHRTGGAACGP